jgi:hypothetical protein
VFRRGKYAAGKRVGKGDMLKAVSPRGELGGGRWGEEVGQPGGEAAREG